MAIELSKRDRASLRRRTGAGTRSPFANDREAEEESELDGTLQLSPQEVESLRNSTEPTRSRNEGPLRREAQVHSDRNTENWAEVSDLSEQTGIPKSTVDRQKARVRKDVLLGNMDIPGMSRWSPLTAEFLSEDEGRTGLVTPRDMANLRQTEGLVTGRGSGLKQDQQSEAKMTGLTKGDYHGLSYTEEPILTGLAQAWELAEPLFDRGGSADLLNPQSKQFVAGMVRDVGRAVSGLASLGEMAGRSVARAFGAEGDMADPRELTSQEIARDTRTLTNIIAGEDTRRAETTTEEMFLRGAGGFTTQMLGLYKSAPLAIAQSLGLSASQATQEQVQAGTLGESASSDAGIAAASAAIGILELSPLEFAARTPISKVKGGAVRRTVEAGASGAAELFTEWAANGMLYLESELFTSEEDAEWRGLSPSAAAMSALFGTSAGVMGQVTTRGVQGAHKDQIESMKALAEGASLDKVAQIAQDSDLRATHQQSYRRFLQKAGTDETFVHIDGPEVKEIMSEKSPSEIEQDPGLRKIQAALDNRDSANQDAAVTLTDYLTDIAPSNDYTAIRRHARMNPEADSLARRQQSFQENQEFVDELAQKAENDAQAQKNLDQTRKIEETIANQITQTGVIDPRTAKKMAQTSAARFARMASERGKSPMQLFRESGLTTQGPDSARREGGTLNIGLDTTAGSDGTPLDPDEVIEVLESEGIQVSGQALRESDTEETLVVETTEPVAQEQGDRIADALQQDSVVQMRGGAGQVFGRNQQGVEFDQDRFITPSGRTAREEAEVDDGTLEQEGPQREEDGALRGLPRIRGASPSEQIQRVARDYMATTDAPYNPPDTYATVDKQRAERIAQLYDEMEHAPEDPEVRAAYNAMIEETLAQYEAITETGLQVEFIPEGRDPYADTPRQATEDIRQNNHFWTFSTQQGYGQGQPVDPGDNPMLRETKFTTANGEPMLVNDVFRVVHDYFGHAKEGVGFRANGEENAWRIHSAMYSPLARRAMTTETRGQNSWVNFGPYGRRNRRASAEDTVFADQKIGLLPEWVSTTAAGDAPVIVEEGIPTFHSKPRQEHSESVVAYHLGRKPGLDALDPQMSGTGTPGPDTKAGGRPGQKQPLWAQVPFFVGTADEVPDYQDVGALRQQARALYRTKLTNLYNLYEDPLDLQQQADPTGLNQEAIRKAVSDAGYDGILRKRTEDQWVAFTFDLGEGVQVPVQEVDSRGVPLEERPSAQLEQRARGRQEAPPETAAGEAASRLTRHLVNPDQSGAHAQARSGNIAVDTREQPLRGATLYEPTSGLDLSPVVEMPDSQTGVQTFVNAAKAARRQNPAVSVLNKDDYAQMRLFTTQDGQAGVAVKSNGEIVTPFGSVDGRTSALSVALQNGGSWLRSLETETVDAYRQLGFEVVRRQDWDPDQKPREWKVSERGKPDRLTMVHRPRGAPSMTAAGTVSAARQRRSQWLEETRTLRQGARADFTPGRNLIRLFENANATSWMHEFGHFMKTVEDAENSQHSADINEWHSRNAERVAQEAGTAAESVQTYLDEGTTGDLSTDDQIETALQEQFARAWETYLMEGRAPSAGLRDAFRTFARQFEEIYRDVQGDLDVPMDPGIRAVFDRMLASAEQIDEVAQSERYRGLFSDATMAGMTEQQWEQYQNHQNNVRDQAAETLREQLFKKLRRRESKQWKEEEQAIYDELLPEIENNRVNTARRALQDDRPIDRRATKELVGQMVTDAKGRTYERLPPQLNNMTQTGGEALTPTQAALTLGYNSGAEMLQDIIRAPTARQKAEQRAAEIMRERHGGDLDTNVEAMVDRAMENEAHAQMLLDELKALGRQKGETQRQQIRQMARDRVAEKTYRELSPEAYRSAEVRAAKQAQKAWDTGDREGAARAKTEQLVNHYLAIEARTAKERIESQVDKLNKYRKKSTREAIQASRGGHWEQIKRILNRFEFRKSASLRSVDEYNENLAQWAENRITTYGEALEIPPELMREDFVTHWKNIPLRQLEGVLGTIQNIEHVARRSAEVLRGDERVSHEKTMEEVQRRLGELPQKFKQKRTDAVDRRRKGGVRKGWREYIADQTKVPWLVSWMDQGERTGFFHSLFTDPINKAFNRRQEMLQEHLEPVLQTFENLSDDAKRMLATEFYFDGLPNEDKHFYGETVMMVAMNTGNQQNLEKLIIGEGWGSRDNPDSLSINNPYLQEVLAPLTQEHWDAVQSIWDRMEALYPSLKETYERASGKELAGVTPQEVETPFGVYRGGYFPAVMDRGRGATAQTQEEADAADQMFAPNGIRQIGVTSDATQERTQAAYPLKLSLDVVASHFEDTIHYISYHDAVRSINRILQDPRFRQSFTAAFGEAEFAHLKPWLEAVAKQGRTSEERRGWFRGLRRLRMGLTYGVMGFKYSTMMAQTLGLSNAAAEVGTRNILRALGTIAKDMTQMENAMTFARENSDLMEHRISVFDRDVGAALERLEQQAGAPGKAKAGWRRVQKTSLKAIGLVQLYMVDLPTWYGAYMKEMEKSGDEAAAFQYADWTVDNVQGSGRVESMSAVMRDQREEVRVYTQFMTFFSSLWNAQRDLYEGARTQQYGASEIGARLIFMLAVPAIADMFMRGDLLPEEDEDETAETQAWKALGRTALLPTATMPILRVAGGVAQGYQYSFNPVGDLYGDILTTIGELGRAATDEDKDVTGSLAKSAFYTGGALLHIPGTHQAWGTAEHLWQVMEEGERLTFQQLAYGADRDED